MRSPSSALVLFFALSLFTAAFAQAGSPTLQQPKTPEELLFFAALNGLNPMSVAALSKGANPNTRIKGGLTPLMVAAASGSSGVIQTLLEHKADPNLADEIGRTAILYATMKHQRLAVQALLAAGATPKIRDKDGKSFVMYAAEYGDTGIANIAMAAYVNEQNSSFNNTPLMFAALSGNIEIIQSLLKKNPGSVNNQNNAGETALLRAANHGHFYAVSALLNSGADKSIKDNSGKTPADHARLQGHSEIAALLDGNKSTLPEAKLKQALWRAASLGDCDLLKLALNDGASVDARDPEVGFTALMLAAGAGQECAADLLLTHGANPSATSTKFGKTPLMYASENGHTNIVQMLVAKGVNVNFAMLGGDTALIFSVDRGNDQPDIIKILAKGGAKLNARDHEGKTALMAAAMYGEREAVVTLLALGADKLATDPSGRTAVIYAVNSHESEIRQLLSGISQSESMAHTGNPSESAPLLFSLPAGIATDGSNLFVTDSGHRVIRKIVIASGESNILAGSGAKDSVDGMGMAAAFNYPTGLTIDRGNLYVADNNKIRKIVIATGAVTTLAVLGTTGVANDTGKTPKYSVSNGITTDGVNLYVSDSENNKIRQIVISTGKETILAGSGSYGHFDATGAAATFGRPTGIIFNEGNLYVTDFNIRKIAIANGTVSTVAGSGTKGSVDGTGTTASFRNPLGITTDGSNLYVADFESHQVRKIAIATGIVTTVAGSGTRNSVDGKGTAASFNSPLGVTTDGRNLYVAEMDALNRGVIRKVDIATGVVTTPGRPDK